MDEGKALAQKQMMLQQQQQQQQQQHQQLLLFQQMQQHHKQQQQQQHLQQQQQAMSRFPSNIDAHLRPPGLQHRSISPQQHQQSPNPNPNLQQNQMHNSNPLLQQQQHQQQQQQQKAIRPPANQVEMQMAYHDAWRVCHPDFKRPFSSLEDACERLLPYHVVADYEAEEDDRILDSDTTGQMLSRCQQWDNNIATKVAEFTATFEKQALAFNIITRKRAAGEFRSEERLMLEQGLMNEEKRAAIELRTEIESREKAAHEIKMRMAALAQAEQARAESQAHAEIAARAPIRGSALGGSSGGDIGMVHGMVGQEQGGVMGDDSMNGWGNNLQREEKEPSEDFLNDEETDNGETSTQHEWRGVGEFDLNTR